MIEKLDVSHKAEILGTLGQAFATHPMLPPGTPAKTAKAMTELMLIVDSEVHCGTLPLCNMRRDKEGTADSSRSG